MVLPELRFSAACAIGSLVSSTRMLRNVNDTFVALGSMLNVCTMESGVTDVKGDAKGVRAFETLVIHLLKRCFLRGLLNDFTTGDVSLYFVLGSTNVG